MSGISTHVLDTSSGKPASGVRVRLYRESEEICSAATNADGRCPALLPPGVPLETAKYRLLFEVDSHFPDGFFPEISISFLVRDPEANHHVPLLISPFGFTSYRGS